MRRPSAVNHHCGTDPELAGRTGLGQHERRNALARAGYGPPDRALAGTAASQVKAAAALASIMPGISLPNGALDSAL